MTKINNIIIDSTNNISSIDLNKDYYKTLGIKHAVTKKEIREAYLNMVKKHHPDITKKGDSTQFFKEIANSFQVLSNKKTKRFYVENNERFHTQNHLNYETR